MEADKEGTILKIKQKKELSGLSDNIVSESLDKCLQKNKISLESLKERDLKFVIKEVRAELRKYAGRFNKNSESRKELLKENKISELLRTHSSTSERYESYSELKKLIESLKIKSILDLGSGINPIALSKRGINYYACDINEDDLNLVKQYFEKNNILGNVFFYDLRNIKEDLPYADLCLIFKVLDVLERKGHKLAEKIIKSINSKYILISFSTKTLSGRPMNHPQRGWIERLLNRLNYHFKIIKQKNEIFYLVENPNCL